VHIGNFVEVKNAQLGNDSKANHLAYVGDASVGERVNIGAGTIIANYDGANKHRTTIENDVHTDPTVCWSPRSPWAPGPLSRPANGGEGSAGSKADSGPRKASHNRKLAASYEAEEIGVR